MFPENIPPGEEGDMIPDEEKVPPLDSYGQIYIMLMKLIERGAFGFRKRTSLSGLLDSLFGSGRGRDKTEVVKRILGVCPYYMKDGIKVVMIGRWLNKHKGVTEVWLRFGDEKGFNSENQLEDVRITREDWLTFLEQMSIFDYYDRHASVKMKKCIENEYYCKPEEHEDMQMAEEIRMKAMLELRENGV